MRSDLKYFNYFILLGLVVCKLINMRIDHYVMSKCALQVLSIIIIIVIIFINSNPRLKINQGVFS